MEQDFTHENKKGNGCQRKGHDRADTAANQLNHTWFAAHIKPCAYDVDADEGQCNGHANEQQNR